MSSSFSPYAGHSIFRNQPPYTHFNKSFDDPGDSLFLYLNEIDPLFLKKEHLEDNRGFENCMLFDPRTKKEVVEVEYDHTRACEPKVFRSKYKSNLTKMEHKQCLKVLLAQQEKRPPKPEDIAKWQELEIKRNKEQKLMQKFAFEYAQDHKEAIYEPTKKLVELYKTWYKWKTAYLLEQLEDEKFNTYSGLPLARVCKSLNERYAEIAEVKLLERRGSVLLWRQENMLQFDEIVQKLQTYTDSYNETLKEHEKLLHLEELESDDAERPNFFIPLESLLFLLNAGDYVDMPTEVTLQIKDGLIKFAEPLPARNCGWHTHNQIMEHAFSVYLKTKGRKLRLQVHNEQVKLQHLQEPEEIKAYSEQKLEFAPQKIEDFIQKHYERFEQLKEKHQLNAALIKWQLRPTDSEDGLSILTTLELPPTLNERATQFLGSFSVKLEYKTQFGCEIMTKYELQRLWLQMSFMTAINEVNDAKCLRIAAANFQKQLEQNLTLTQIEQQLAEIYHINMPQLLSNLEEFLKLLINIPTGKYLMRYNAKYKDKLLLCAPAQELTNTTVSLHALLRSEPSDLLFMTQTPYLHISDKLCSFMHAYHQILPCAFPASSASHKRRLPLDKDLPRKTVNDRIQLLQREKNKSHAVQVHCLLNQKKRKLNKMQRRRVRKKQTKEQENKAAIELEEWIIS